MKPVIDISKFNSVTNWDVLKENVFAVIIRLGVTGWGSGKIVVDPKYKEFREGCEKHGIPFSLYFFPQSLTRAEAEREADFIIENAKTINNRIMPVWLDSETADVQNKPPRGRADNISRDLRTEMLRIICERVNAAGIECGVYASTSWLKDRLDMSKLPYPVWVAQYSSRCTYKGSFLLWQYSSQGKVPGVKTGNQNYVDVSHWLGEAVKNVPYVPGWHQDEEGWWYADSEESYCKSEWKDINNHWYYFGPDGYIYKGWQKIAGEWYYFEENGDLEGALYRTDERGAQKIWEIKQPEE